MELKNECGSRVLILCAARMKPSLSLSVHSRCQIQRDYSQSVDYSFGDPGDPNRHRSIYGSLSLSSN